MTDTKGNTAVPSHGDVDRVQMMSLRADGTPDQTAGFEIIGDKEVALEQSREQFRQQAVSAVDQRERGVAGDGGTSVPDAPQDPFIADLTEKHEAAADAAVKAAEIAVGAAFTDDPARDKTPAVRKASTTSAESK
jgi:cellulase/cellobiase CelA1